MPLLNKPTNRWINKHTDHLLAVLKHLYIWHNYYAVTSASDARSDKTNPTSRLICLCFSATLPSAWPFLLCDWPLTSDLPADISLSAVTNVIRRRQRRVQWKDMSGRGSWWRFCGWGGKGWRCRELMWHWNGRWPSLCSGLWRSARGKKKKRVTERAFGK